MSRFNYIKHVFPVPESMTPMLGFHGKTDNYLADAASCGWMVLFAIVESDDGDDSLKC